MSARATGCLKIRKKTSKKQNKTTTPKQNKPKIYGGKNEQINNLRVMLYYNGCCLSRVYFRSETHVLEKRKIMTMEGPKFSKRKKLGKNKKKSWRGIDISSVEDFLNEERLEQRTAGLASEKTNDQLFMVQRNTSDATAENVDVKKKLNSDLKCYSNLINRFTIACPRKEYPTSEYYNTRSLRALEKRGAAKKETTAAAATEPSKGAKRGVVDIWGDEEKTQEEGDDFFNQVTKRKRVQPPKNIRRKCSERSVVELPHPGASVNPAYDDHQDLLLQAHVVEMKKEKAVRKVFNALDAQFPSANEAPTEATWMKEMSAGLDEEPHLDEAVEDDRHISINPPVNREKKKTPREKRKEKAAKLLKHVMAEKKVKKEIENKVFSVAKIRSQLAKERKEMKQRAELKAKKREEKKYTPKKLGKMKVEVPEMEVKLTNELVGSLRSVKPEGHLLEDRYRSLQMRNMVEARAKAHKKKTKTKKFEKKSFREITV